MTHSIQHAAAVAAMPTAPPPPVPVARAAAVAAPSQAQQQAPFKMLSKHDEKWNIMFDKFIGYKEKHGSTLVPQCYSEDPRLGRWVHYQRGT